MLWVFEQIFYTESDDYRRQIMTSKAVVRLWRLKSIPELKGLKLKKLAAFLEIAYLSNFFRY